MKTLLQQSTAIKQNWKIEKFEGTNAELAAKIEKLQGEATTKETEYKEQLENYAKLMQLN